MQAKLLQPNLFLVAGFSTIFTNFAGRSFSTTTPVNNSYPEPVSSSLLMDAHVTGESLCTKCGALPEVGFIFCKKCGAALGPTDPLISTAKTEIGPSRTSKFSLWRWAVLFLVIVAIPLPLPYAVRILTVLLPILAVGLVLVIYGTVRKNTWGVNLKPVNCPRCNLPMPQRRKPKSVSQAMWGGWTCEQCGCEVDKWGRQIKSA